MSHSTTHRATAHRATTHRVPATTGRTSNTAAAGPIAWHGSVNGHAQAVVLMAGTPTAERPDRR